MIVVLCPAIICLALSFSNAQSGGCGNCSIDDKWPKVGSCLILIGEYEGDGEPAILATEDK